MQPEFVAELFRRLHEHNIHTALDTAGAGDLSRAKQVLKHTDLVLCDIKFPTEAQYKSHCGGSLQHTIDFMRLTESMHIPLWGRHVVAPGLSDTVESLRAVKALAESFSNLEKIEWLPFKNICAAKYKALHIPFTKPRRSAPFKAIISSKKAVPHFAGQPFRFHLYFRFGLDLYIF